MAGLGLFFIGLGVCAVLLAITGFFCVVARRESSDVDVHVRHNVFELSSLNQLAQNAGMNLDVELEKMSLSKKRKFRERVYEEMLKQTFDKEKAQK